MLEKIEIFIGYLLLILLALGLIYIIFECPEQLKSFIYGRGWQ